MTAIELNEKMVYYGHERCARKLLIREKLVPVEKVAVMSSIEVCSEIVNHFEVVGFEGDNIILVRKKDMETFDEIVEKLFR